MLYHYKKNKNNTKNNTSKGRRNQGTRMKRILDVRDQNVSTSGPTPWQLQDDDDDDVEEYNLKITYSGVFLRCLYIYLHKWGNQRFTLWKS